MTTAYTNLGGTGIRNPAITVTPSGGLVSSGVSTALLDGSQADAYWWNSGQTAASVIFDFGAGQHPIIDEFTWYQSGIQSQGTWSWRGSPDNSTWTDLSTGINLGGTSASEAHGYTNSTGYRYYGLFQTGGSTSNSPYIREIEFKISGFRMLIPDGFASGSSHSATTAAATLTTTRSDDIIIALIGAELAAAGSPQVSSISNTAGLTWGLRKRLTFTGGRHTNPQVVEIWWAHAPSPLTADVTTVTFNGAMDNANVTVFAVAGATISAPWDTNGSLPATNTDVTGSTTNPSVGGVATNGSNVMAIAFWGSGNNSNAVGTPPTGFTIIDHVSNTLGTDWEYTHSAYKGSIAALSSETETFTEGELDWGMVVDAIVVDPGGLAGTMAVTDTPDTFAAAGWSVAAGITATFMVTENADTFAATGYIHTLGTWLSTEAPDIFSAYGIRPITGSLAVTEAKDIFAALATTPGVSGRWSSIEAVDVVNVIGYTPVSGTFTVVEAPDIFQALGSGAALTTLRRVFFVC
jgi:hypothetical protein